MKAVTLRFDRVNPMYLKKLMRMADTKLEIMNKREIKDLYTQLDFNSVEPFLLPREFGASYANHERMLLE